MYDENYRTVFVTVGTTLFDDLVDTVSNVNFLCSIYELGFRRIVIQFGKGTVPSFVPNKSVCFLSDNDARIQGIFILPEDAQKSLKWETYRFKPSLEQDMNDAHLIISHAGAGCIMEGLSKCKEANSCIPQNETKIWKKLVCVINDKLMHNHQTELAEALEKRGYLFVLSTPRQLLNEEIIEKIDSFTPKTFKGGDNLVFSRLLDAYLGF